MKTMQRRDFNKNIANLGLGSIIFDQLRPNNANARPKDQFYRIYGRPIEQIPEWAILQRQLIENCSLACEVFYKKYFDNRGYFECFERWGANDGPDDAIENVNAWPILHAIGGHNSLKTNYETAWHGHLEQFTNAKTTAVKAGQRGMYSRGFSVMNDWQHLSEGLTAFNSMGLSNPKSRAFSRYADFAANLYNGKDAIAKNYDPKLKIIKSMITGSRGPLMRQMTPMEWAGDPFDTSNFFMAHGERNYQETLDHYADYGDVVGDSPLNLQATSLALSAYLYTQNSDHRNWILDYVYAWANRMRENNNIIPSKIAPNGKINSAEYPWWSGVYGWGFSPIVPQTGIRENRNRVPRSFTGFINAFLLSGDETLFELWRIQATEINNNGKTINGEFHTPTMFNKDGWYGFQKGTNQANIREIWYFTMRENELDRTNDKHPWCEFLYGRNNAYPTESLRKDLAEIEKRLDLIKNDTTTKATRLADAALDFNCALVTNLVHQTMGGIHIARPPWSRSSAQQGGVHLFARLRHFDAKSRRAGLPSDVAVLVTKLTKTHTHFSIINNSENATRETITQIGGFNEHRLESIIIDGNETKTNASAIHTILPPKHAAEIIISHSLYVKQPSFAWPI